MKRHAWLAGVAAVLMLAPSAFAIQKRHKMSKLGVGVYLASEFDAATTYHALQTCRGGCYEANPMVRPFARNPGVFVVLGASAYSVNYLANRLQESGHRRWATVFRVLVIGVHAGAGIQNLALVH